jgi:hypothetical protein
MHPPSCVPAADEAGEEDEAEAVTTVQLAIAVDEPPATGDEPAAPPPEPS